MMRVLTYEPLTAVELLLKYVSTTRIHCSAIRNKIHYPDRTQGPQNHARDRNTWRRMFLVS